MSPALPASVEQAVRRVLLILNLALAIAIPSWLYGDAVVQASSLIDNRIDAANLAAVSGVARGIDRRVGEIRASARRLASDVRVAHELAAQSPSASAELQEILRDWLSSLTDVKAVYILDRSSGVISSASRQRENGASTDADLDILQGRVARMPTVDSWLVFREPVPTGPAQTSVAVVVPLSSLTDLFTALPPWTDFALRTNDGRTLFDRGGSLPGIVIEVPPIAEVWNGDAGVSDGRGPEDRSIFAQSMQLPAFVTVAGSSHWTISKTPLFVADAALFLIGSLLVVVCTRTPKPQRGGDAQAVRAGLRAAKRGRARAHGAGHPV